MHTSESVSLAVHSVPLRENTCTSFEFKLTATSVRSMYQNAVDIEKGDLWTDDFGQH